MTLDVVNCVPEGGFAFHVEWDPGRKQWKASLEHPDKKGRAYAMSPDFWRAICLCFDGWKIACMQIYAMPLVHQSAREMAGMS